MLGPMTFPFALFPAELMGLKMASAPAADPLPPPAAPQAGAPWAGEAAAGRLYHEGRRRMRLFDIEGYKEAVTCFMQVKALLPDFCPVYAALAETYAYWGFRQEIAGLEPGTFYDLAYEHSQSALELAHDSGEAHRAAALALRGGPRRDPARRRWHAERAAEINPYNAETLWELWRSRGHDPADSAITKALALDPTLCGAHNDLGAALSDAGRHEEALSHLAEAARINPRNSLVHYNMGMVLFRQGQWEEAMCRLEWGLGLHPDDPLLCMGVELLVRERVARTLQ